MIPYSHTEVNQFKSKNQMQRSHSKRGIQCMFLPIGLPLLSNRLSIRLTQDQKGLSKAYNRDECKGVFTVLQHHWFRRTFPALLDFSFFFSPQPNLGFWPKLVIH
ncbi:hypothetical protein H5410_045659 [Solanum commersonii]|uniref:Uncharacterized protein n=1 Tax=Solanum commersonii TaxID=4109 RepID=A0A9J5XA49_SOLCO|nr:hypothetical protein H5410_045659 [Solanum commersonii]